MSSNMSFGSHRALNRWFRQQVLEKGQRKVRKMLEDLPVEPVESIEPVEAPAAKAAAVA